jgi:hypothetical protein
VVCRLSQPIDADPQTTWATDVPDCGCAGTCRRRRRGRCRSRPSSARRRARSPSTAGPRTSTWCRATRPRRGRRRPLLGDANTGR